MMHTAKGHQTERITIMKIAILSIVFVAVITLILLMCCDRKKDQLLFGIERSDGTYLYSVSIIELIASPDKYDGKRVYVQGYYAEGNQAPELYLDESHYINILYRNALDVDKRNSNADISFASLHEKYVSFIGIFSANEHRYQDYTRGTLHSITLARAIPIRSTADQTANDGADRSNSMIISDEVQQE